MLKQKVTELPKYQRIIEIYAHLIRNRRRRFSVQNIKEFLEESGGVSQSISLRNVQRDLKDILDIADSAVGYARENKQLRYFIEPDMRNKLTLPIQRNNLLAFFLLKRLQPFFARKAKSLEQLSETITDLVGEADYNQFEDLDEKLEESTFLFGEQSPLALDDRYFNDLLTSLIKHRKLNILYSRPGDKEPREMTICPVKLVLFKGELYFSCLSENEKRSDFYIKLCRIQKAELSRELFTPDPKRLARIEKRLSSSFGLLDDADEKPQKIIIRFPPNEYYDRIFTERRFHHSQRLSKDAKGNRLLSMEAPVGMDLINWVLSWPEAEVLDPESLKKELLEVGKILVKKYME